MSPTVLMLLACATRPAAVEPTVPAATAVAPESPPPQVAPPAAAYPHAYKPEGLDGGPQPFARWQGQVVLVSVWASWCPPCIEELPVLLALEAAWQPRGLQVVGVAIDDTPARVQATADARGLTWPQALDGSNRASQVFDTDELPTTLLYGADGTLLYKQVGPLEPQDPDLEAALSAALGG
jgi:thiol-disulfide isomerase/thioredoxin